MTVESLLQQLFDLSEYISKKKKKERKNEKKHV